MHPLIAELRNRTSKVTTPKHAHPIARLIFELMRRHAVTYDLLEHCSGVLRQTLKSYRQEKVPSLRTAEALLGSFGWNLVPVPPISSLNPETRQAVEAIADQFDSADAVIGAALAAINLAPTFTDAGPAPRVQLPQPNVKALAA